MMIMQRTRHVKDMQNREEVVIRIVGDVGGKRRRSEQPEGKNGGAVKSMQRHSA
jgi:hypothetical protein